MLMENARKLGLIIPILILFFLMEVVHSGFPGEKREGGTGVSWDTPTARGELSSKVVSFLSKVGLSIFS
jgi:hypothetical protein